MDTEFAIFKDLFVFLGFPERSITRLLEIAAEKSLFSGRIEPSIHVRSGKVRQWQQYFTDAHHERFSELLPDALQRLGYPAERPRQNVIARLADGADT